MIHFWKTDLLFQVLQIRNSALIIIIQDPNLENNNKAYLHLTQLPHPACILLRQSTVVLNPWMTSVRWPWLEVLILQSLEKTSLRGEACVLWLQNTFVSISFWLPNHWWSVQKVCGVFWQVHLESLSLKKTIKKTRTS